MTDRPTKIPLTEGSSRRQALWLAAAGIATLASSGWTGAQAATNRALSAKRLDIEGNRLLAGGEPVRLIGVAVGDPLFVRADRTTADFRVLATDWRANVVRISLHPAQWRNQRAASLAGLARDIGAARAQGLWVILDWHAIGAPGGWYDKPGADWGLPMDIYRSDLATAADFWREMSKRYGADPGVVFELWNEPAVDPDIYWSTGKFWPQLKRDWLELIAVIRQHSEAIILASSARFAHDLIGVKANLIADPRVAYAWHCYPDEDKGKPGRWHASLDGLPAVKPVVVTEWGFCRPCEGGLSDTPDGFGRPFVEQVLERYKLHSTAWCYSPGAAPQMLEADGRPSEFGAFVKHQIATAARP